MLESLFNKVSGLQDLVLGAKKLCNQTIFTIERTIVDKTRNFVVIIGFISRKIPELFFAERIYSFPIFFFNFILHLLNFIKTC